MIRIMMLILLVLWTNSVYAEITLNDDRGQELILPAPAQRIVSLAPHLSELLFAAGAGASLVGTAAFSDFPEEVHQISIIGDSNAIDIERVVALKPDVVLAWRSGNSAGTIDKLEQLGLQVFVTEPGTLEAIAEQIVELGHIAGTEETAVAVAARMRAEIATLRQKYKGLRPVSVFYQVWHEPLMTVNGKHVINEVISLCGGKNIFAGLPSLVPQVSLETVIAANPEAIVTASDQPATRALANWLPWKQLHAVHDGNLLVIPSDEISRPTPRLLEGARRLCSDLERVRQGRKGRS